MKFTKVSIVGKGEGWQDAPTEGEVWGVNEIVLAKESITRVFQLHTPEVIRRLELQRQALECANERNIPFVTIANLVESSTCEIYPIEEIITYFNTRYFANSICYMIAYALYYGAKELHLFGINHFNERKHRGCVEYWLGRAEGMGVTVKIHRLSKLLKTETGHLYGY